MNKRLLSVYLEPDAQREFEVNPFLTAARFALVFGIVSQFLVDPMCRCCDGPTHGGICLRP